MSLLGGKASAGVYIDGRLIVGNAGNWGWTENDEVTGPGGYNGPQPGLYHYLPPAPPTYLSPQLATEFYGNGEGRWILYYAERSGPYSLDSDGHRWNDRVALDFVGDYQILTDFTYLPLIFRHAVTGIEQRVNKPGEWTELPDGSTWFSRNYRGCYRGTDFWACGYQAKYGGMCLWRPAMPTMPTYILSRALDFNPDIAVRESDGLLTIGSGQNQGETAQNLYIINTSQGLFQKNGGPWQVLEPVTEPQPEPHPPVVAIGRPLWLGWYEFGMPTIAPSNCRIRLAPVGQPTLGPVYVQAADGTKLARYVQASSDSNVDELEQRIREAKQAEPTMPVLAYWTAQAQTVRVPAGADFVGVEAYQHVGEPWSAYEARVAAGVVRCTKPWLIAQCYTSNSGNTQDLEGVAGVVSRVAQHYVNVQGILAFSGSGRATGYQDHPEVHDEWRAVTEGIMGAPPLPQPPQPQPPEPTPIPPQPIPVPPKPVPPPPNRFTRLLVLKEFHMAAAARLISSAMFKKLSNGKVVVHIQNPIPFDYVGLADAGAPKNTVLKDHNNSTATQGVVTLSCGPGGVWQCRPKDGWEGGWEVANPQGGLLAYSPEGPESTYVLPYADPA